MAFPNCKQKCLGEDAQFKRPNGLICPVFRAFRYNRSDIEAAELAARVQSNARRQEQTKIEKAREAERVARIPDFRANLRTGDRARISSRTAGGLVEVRGLAVEVKPPLALIQFPNELRWVRIEDLYPEN